MTDTFKRGDRVTKKSGSSWSGVVVGEYSTSLTPTGYAVESETEKGSVQIYPAKALRLLETQDQLTPTPEHMALGVGRPVVYMDDYAELAWGSACRVAVASGGKSFPMHINLFKKEMAKVDATDAYIENFIAQKTADQ